MIMSQKNTKVLLKLYCETEFPRRIKARLFGMKEFWERQQVFEHELDRRGLVTQLDKYSRKLHVQEIKKSANSKIREFRDKRDYTVENLSFLHFIECMISEGTGYPLDIIKVEICLVLFHKYDIFKNIEGMMEEYKEYGLSIFDKMPGNEVALTSFLDDLYIYLFDVGKMFVSEFGHDFRIHKELKGELELIPIQLFDEKFTYFSEIPYFYIK